MGGSRQRGEGTGETFAAVDTVCGSHCVPDNGPECGQYPEVVVDVAFPQVASGASQVSQVGANQQLPPSDDRVRVSVSTRPAASGKASGKTTSGCEHR